MKRLTAILAATFLAALLALGLAACGDDDGDSAAAATTAAAEQAAPTTSTPAADLRVTLDRLLGEHAVLAMNAMRSGHDGAKDFEQNAATLEENTVALGDAIGSVYGAEGQKAFLKLWRDHIGFFVEYTVATAKDDAAGQKAALDKLAGYRVAFATFLSNANPNLPKDTVDQVVGMHVGHLADWMVAYHAGDYVKANQLYREAFAHMFAIGDALSGAIVAQFPEKFAA